MPYVDVEFSSSQLVRKIAWHSQLAPRTFKRLVDDAADEGKPG